MLNTNRLADSLHHPLCSYTFCPARPHCLGFQHFILATIFRDATVPKGTGQLHLAKTPQSF